MPPHTLIPEQEFLCRELIETFLAGLHKSRPDLDYPESHSDMTWAMQAVMSMFEIKRRPLMEKPQYTCCGERAEKDVTLTQGHRFAYSATLTPDELKRIPADILSKIGLYVDGTNAKCTCGHRFRDHRDGGECRADGCNACFKFLFAAHE